MQGASTNYVQESGRQRSATKDLAAKLAAALPGWYTPEIAQKCDTLKGFGPAAITQCNSALSGAYQASSADAILKRRGNNMPAVHNWDGVTSLSCLQVAE